jgi:hypothetical protein
LKYLRFAVIILQPAIARFTPGTTDEQKMHSMWFDQFSDKPILSALRGFLSFVQNISNKNLASSEDDLGARLNASVLWFFKRFLTALLSR